MAAASEGAEGRYAAGASDRIERMKKEGESHEYSDRDKQKPLLEVKGLKQYFPVSRKFTVKAVEDVSFISIRARPMVLWGIRIGKDDDRAGADPPLRSDRRTNYL